jgi:putative endonuclease
MTWQVYIIETASGKYYTGIATDAGRRFQEHKDGGAKAAKYFRIDAPRKLVYRELCANRSEASQREAQIKALSRIQKAELIKSCV